MPNYSEENGVRYTELLRLEYFDIIRMMITDPMHTFLLGMVHNEVKLCLSSMSVNNATEFQSRIKRIRIPYDLGRLPTNIFNKSGGLTELTAQQWKNFSLHLCPTMLHWIDIRQSIPSNALTMSNC